MIECPDCGSETFEIQREAGYGDAGLALLCSDCGNSTAQAVARTLDVRLQKEDGQRSFGGNWE